jgi:hypothetical protein
MLQFLNYFAGRRHRRCRENAPSRLQFHAEAVPRKTTTGRSDWMGAQFSAQFLAIPNRRLVQVKNIGNRRQICCQYESVQNGHSCPSARTLGPCTFGAAPFRSKGHPALPFWVDGHGRQCLIGTLFSKWARHFDLLHPSGPAQCTSMRTSRPSTHPKSARLCRNACKRSCAS